MYTARLPPTSDMKSFKKRIYVAAGYNTIYMGPGRKEFDPKQPTRGLESYLHEAYTGVANQLQNLDFDEGIVCNFMAPRFVRQGNLAGFLPAVAPNLLHKPCTGVEGACGSGGRALDTAIRALLSECASTVLVLGVEIQTTVKAVYGADILAGAGYHAAQRKNGAAYFFPGLFSDRAQAYFKAYGEKATREAMAKWYEQAILNARKNPKAQEYHNQTDDLYALGLTPPDSEQFVAHLNLYDCSKITDGASGLVVATKEGLEKLGVAPSNAAEVVGLGAAEGDITRNPTSSTKLETTRCATHKALKQAGISVEDLGILELHDCFSITALLALESVGVVKHGKAPDFISQGCTSIDGTLPTNLSGGLCGFGHPVGASGIRQMVDLLYQLTGQAPNQATIKKPYGLMVSMGGNDVTVTAVVVKGDDGKHEF